MTAFNREHVSSRVGKFYYIYTLLLIFLDTYIYFSSRELVSEEVRVDELIWRRKWGGNDEGSGDHESGSEVKGEKVLSTLP